MHAWTQACRPVRGPEEPRVETEANRKLWRKKASLDRSAVALQGKFLTTGPPGKSLKTGLGFNESQLSTSYPSPPLCLSFPSCKMEMTETPGTSHSFLGAWPGSGRSWGQIRPWGGTLRTFLCIPRIFQKCVKNEGRGGYFTSGSPVSLKGNMCVCVCVYIYIFFSPLFVGFESFILG